MVVETGNISAIAFLVVVWVVIWPRIKCFDENLLLVVPIFFFSLALGSLERSATFWFLLAMWPLPRSDVPTLTPATRCGGSCFERREVGVACVLPARPPGRFSFHLESGVNQW